MSVRTKRAVWGLAIFPVVLALTAAPAFASTSITLFPPVVRMDAGQEVVRVTIANTGTQPFDVEASREVRWVKVDPAAFSLGPGQQQVVRLYIEYRKASKLDDVVSDTEVAFTIPGPTTGGDVVVSGGVGAVLDFKPWKPLAETAPEPASPTTTPPMPWVALALGALIVVAAVALYVGRRHRRQRRPRLAGF